MARAPSGKFALLPERGRAPSALSLSVRIPSSPGAQGFAQANKFWLVRHRSPEKLTWCASLAPPGLAAKIPPPPVALSSRSVTKQGHDARHHSCHSSIAEGAGARRASVVAVLMPIWLLVEYLPDRGATRPTTIDARLQFGAAGVGALASWACWATHASGY